MSKVVVIGQGYVGLPIAMAAVDAGFDVVGLDIDPQRVRGLAGGASHVEDIASERLLGALASGRYCPTTHYSDCEGFDFAVITVPTPLLEGSPDLSFIRGCVENLAAYVTRDSTIILESTTYPGTTRELVLPTLENGSGLSGWKDFHVGYSPERIDPGNKVHTLSTTPKVVSGLTDAAVDSAETFYSHIVETVVRVSSPEVAELSKLVENTFRHVNIALVNELAVFADQLDVDIWEAIDAASTKPFGFMRFTPGPGVGGHCLPIDPSYLSWQIKRRTGGSFRFVELANAVNDRMPEHVVRKVIGGLNERRLPVKDSRILLLGMSYKPNTGDVRESPAVKVAEALASLGADLAWCDPHVTAHQVKSLGESVPFSSIELDKAQAIVILADHDDFDYDMVCRATGYVLDTRNRLAGKRDRI